ncbi:hypothetical protein HYU19_03800 [Candidatus Woesearchaeota archaeon]|nr:hypothetical protein [Candidatus Woesearchaeota archaeon]
MVSKRGSKAMRGWHNIPKYMKPTTEGSCSYCHKHVKALEKHLHDKHKAEMKRKK